MIKELKAGVRSPAFSFYEANASKNPMVNQPYPDLPKSNRDQSLNEFVKGRRVMLVFLRHAGCSFCRQTLDDLRKVKSQLEEAETVLAVVHMSTVENMDAILEKFGLAGITHFSDPDKILFQHFELKRGSFNQLLGPKVFWLGFKACIIERYGTGLPEGDGMQMPGVFVLDDGEVIHEFRHANAGERPDYLELLGQA